MTRGGTKHKYGLQSMYRVPAYIHVHSWSIFSCNQFILIISPGCGGFCFILLAVFIPVGHTSASAPTSPMYQGTAPQSPAAAMSPSPRSDSAPILASGMSVRPLRSGPRPGFIEDMGQGIGGVMTQVGGTQGAEGGVFRSSRQEGSSVAQQVGVKGRQRRPSKMMNTRSTPAGHPRTGLDGNG